MRPDRQAPAGHQDGAAPAAEQFGRGMDCMEAARDVERDIALNFGIGSRCTGPAAGRKRRCRGSMRDRPRSGSAVRKADRTLSAWVVSRISPSASMPLLTRREGPKDRDLRGSGRRR